MLTQLMPIAPTPLSAEVTMTQAEGPGGGFAETWAALAAKDDGHVASDGGEADAGAAARAILTALTCNDVLMPLALPVGPMIAPSGETGATPQDTLQPTRAVAIVQPMTPAQISVPTTGAGDAPAPRAMRPVAPAPVGPAARGPRLQDQVAPFADEARDMTLPPPGRGWAVVGAAVSAYPKPSAPIDGAALVADKAEVGEIIVATQPHAGTTEQSDKVVDRTTAQQATPAVEGSVKRVSPPTVAKVANTQIGVAAPDGEAAIRAPGQVGSTEGADGVKGRATTQQSKPAVEALVERVSLPTAAMVADQETGDAATISATKIRPQDRVDPPTVPDEAKGLATTQQTYPPAEGAVRRLSALAPAPDTDTQAIAVASVAETATRPRLNVTTQGRPDEAEAFAGAQHTGSSVEGSQQRVASPVPFPAVIGATIASSAQDRLQIQLNGEADQVRADGSAASDTVTSAPSDARPRIKIDMEEPWTQPPGEAEGLSLDARLIATISDNWRHFGPPPPAMTPGAASVAHAAVLQPPPLVLPPDIAHQLLPAVEAAPDQPIELTLSPKELGRVRMVLNVLNDGVRLVVQADRAETADLMRRHSDQLVRDFRDMGYGQVHLSFESAGQQFGHTHRQPASPAPAAPTTAFAESDAAALPPEIRTASQTALDGRLDMRL